MIDTCSVKVLIGKNFIFKDNSTFTLRLLDTIAFICKKNSHMSISIKAFSESEVETLSELSQQTFLESHGHSAGKKDIQHYMDLHFNTRILSEALENPNIYFNKIYVDNHLAGYTKLILDAPQPSTPLSPIAKFERLYLLKDFYGLQLGNQLLDYNIEIAKFHQQQALWLFVWVENVRALRFYQKNNFKIIGNYDFKISEQHTNPNHVMLKMI